ncbi:penicillin-binding protein [Modestobacter muralis]|uniref:Penicillin-binding protein n=1 Tax=Modestobacter muralis TaxID=1608614 RepID=A0A6P0EUL2_9ACTN|nr:transglycosylase domain-containing protein [Modestobacter muralis]NEK94583.1 penicillin-binding protein [Modestobacter muralis]NEN51471.1 penicillin-binding protein [Modestobacter muralis]
MSESAPSRVGALAKLLVALVVAGGLVAAVLLPFVGGAGLVARNSTTLLDALPVELTDKTPNGNTKVLAANGELITEFYENNRTPATPDQIAPIMKQAIVDIEDSRFYEHKGVDAQGTLRALAKNLAAGGVQEGGSTLTQQLVKQTLLQTAPTAAEARAATEQSVGRKLKEARLALALEQTYSKDEILTRYLNIAYFGHGAYGIEAAARTYFSVGAAELTLPQAAVLAGLVQSPTNDDPLLYPEAAQTRRNQVLQRMHDLGHGGGGQVDQPMTDQELADLSATPVQTAGGAKPPNGCANATIGGYFCDFVKGQLNALGLDDQELANGGYTIQTTLDADLQRSGDAAVLNTLAMGDDLAGTFTAVEPGTGKLLAMSVNRRFGCDGNVDPACESVNLNVSASKGAGSTYKVFTAAAALIEGYGANYTQTTPEPYISKLFKDTDPDTGRLRPWPVQNVGNNYPPTLSMRDALVRSSNTYFVALEDKLGSVEKPVRTAQAMGLKSLDPIADEVIAQNRGSFTLGPDATSPLYLASAYSTLGGNGTQCDPIAVTQVLTSAGQPLTGDDGQPLVKNDNCTPEAIPPGVATTLNQILIGDTESPFGTAKTAAIPGHQIAGKTGTAQDNISVTFVGYTPKYAASVMVFNPTGNQDVGGFGGGKGATIWRDAMAPILANQAPVPFPAADPVVSAGNRPVVPGCSSASACEETLRQAGFRPVTSRVSSSQPVGSLLGTSPAAGAEAEAGQVVTIRVSDGTGARTRAPRPSAPAPSPAPAPAPAPAPEPAPAPDPAPVPTEPTN